MHVTFWAAKRAHWSMVKYSRRLLRRAGVTPARYDLLFLLAKKRVPPTQKAVRLALGVARATMSELLAAVEKRGWVKRGRCADRRMRSVSLTDLGRLIVADVDWKCVFDVDWFVDMCFWRTDVKGQHFDEAAAVLRAALGDVAVRSLYSWPSYED